MRLDATDPKMPEWHKYLFPCDCHDSTYLEVEWWDDFDGYPGYLNITPTFWAPTIRERIKTSIKVLFGKRHYLNGVLLEADTAARLIETVQEQQAALAVKGKEKEDGKV